jgi:hypothetical protein
LRDLLINLLASIIAGVAVWLAGRALRYRRRARRQAFFGLTDGDTCLLSVARHFSSMRENSVHRQDVAALVELAAIARECGARTDLAGDADLTGQFGRQTEFCVGGPSTNLRMATHLRTVLPQVTLSQAAITVGEQTFPSFSSDEKTVLHVLLARVQGPAGGRPAFLLAGQTALTNLAAARYLGQEHRALYRRYRADRPFTLVLRVTEPAAYGTDFTELAADVTAEAG